MAEFSAKERMIATMLSSMPGVKRQVKRIYVLLNSILYKKNYKCKIIDSRLSDIYTISSFTNKKETFFGYYDLCCCYDDHVLIHSINLSSTHLPSPNQPVDLLIKDLNTGNIEKIGISSAYNWQQGSRLHWISNDKILYNIYDPQTNNYRTTLYSIALKKIIKYYEKPVQTSFHEKFFLSINYTRLWNMRPDYCYRCIPKLSKEQLADMENDGIWRVDMKTDKITLVHSIADVIKVEYREQFNLCEHNVNHVMISPDGNRFIFIHRNYLGKRRFDRLILSNFKKMKVVIDENYVSHCCWIDNSTILGYLRYKGEKGFYYINVDTLEVTCCEAMTQLKTGDGHPSFNGRFIAFDTYPDKSRMQKLLIYDSLTKKVYPLIELYQSTKYTDETRCDMHPRFSNDGEKIFFDTVYNGHRELCYVDINNFYIEKKP